MEEVRNYGKIVCIKNIFENGWWMVAYTSSYFLHSPLAVRYKNHQKSLAHSHFNHLVPLVLLFFTKRQSQKRGA